ncbi:polymorphic toxin type 15 domain-containing protein [Gordonia sp. DT30]
MDAATKAANRQHIESVVDEARSASDARARADADLADAMQRGDAREVTAAERRLQQARGRERGAHARMWSELDDKYTEKRDISFARRPGGDDAGYPRLRVGDDGLPEVVPDRTASPDVAERRESLANALARARNEAEDNGLGTDPEKVCGDQRDRHRAELRELERARHTEELEQSDIDTASRDSAAHGEDLTYLLKNPYRYLGEGADRQEAAGQLDAQRHGMETRSVDELLEAIDTYDGTREATAGLRSELRKQLRDRCFDALVGEGISPETAEEVAEAYADVQLYGSGSDQVITHNNDQVAGGRRSASTYGDRDVNGALGSTNQQEKAALRAWLQDLSLRGFGNCAIYVRFAPG